MSTLTLQRGDNTPALDGPNDLRPEQKTSLIIERETPVVKKVQPKKTKS